jgi:hypothetical protein
MYQLTVRNDAAGDRVVVVDFPERGQTWRYLARALGRGITDVSGPGEFDGVITVLDPASCEVVGKFSGRGSFLTVLISSDGSVRFVSVQEAFPDVSSAPERELPKTAACA